MGLPKKLHKLSQPSPTCEVEDEKRGCKKTVLPCAPTTVAIVALKIFPAPCEPEAGLEGRSLEQRRCAEDIVLSTEGDKNPPCSFGKLNVNKKQQFILTRVTKIQESFFKRLVHRNWCREYNHVLRKIQETCA